MALSLPGQSVALCGQPSQVASCRSHSAGMEKPRVAGVGAVVFFAINSCADYTILGACPSKRRQFSTSPLAGTFKTQPFPILQTLTPLPVRQWHELSAKSL